MQKLLNFLLIGLIFTVLQVTNVGAQDKMAPDTVIDVAQGVFHYVCGSSKYDEEARNACFTHERLKELQAKISDLEGQLLDMAAPAKAMGDALNANHVEITALKEEKRIRTILIADLKATITDLEGKLSESQTFAAQLDRTILKQRSEYTDKQNKVSELYNKLIVLTEAQRSSDGALAEAMKKLSANHVEITALKAKNNDLAARIIEKENWIITRSGINDDELRTLKEEVSRVNQALEDAMNDGIQCMKKRDVKIATLERKLLDFKCGQVVKPE
jgi:DNA repair exonuclease SbcCD ATPase subunit